MLLHADDRGRQVVRESPRWSPGDCSLAGERKSVDFVAASESLVQWLLEGHAGDDGRLGRDAQAASRLFALMPHKAVSLLNERSKRHKVKGLDRRLPRRRTCPRRRRGRALPGAASSSSTSPRSRRLLTLHIGGLARRKHTVRKAALEAKPAVQVQLGAGGASTVGALKAERHATEVAKRRLQAGAAMIVIESKGIPEQVRTEMSSGASSRYVKQPRDRGSHSPPRTRYSPPRASTASEKWGGRRRLRAPTADRKKLRRRGDRTRLSNAPLPPSGWREA
jgi:hypothetical protein